MSSIKSNLKKADNSSLFDRRTISPSPKLKTVRFADKNLTRSDSDSDLNNINSNNNNNNNTLLYSTRSDQNLLPKNNKQIFNDKIDEHHSTKLATVTVYKDSNNNIIDNISSVLSGIDINKKQQNKQQQQQQQINNNDLKNDNYNDNFQMKQQQQMEEELFNRKNKYTHKLIEIPIEVDNNNNNIMVTYNINNKILSNSSNNNSNNSNNSNNTNDSQNNNNNNNDKNKLYYQNYENTNITLLNYLSKKHKQQQQQQADNSINSNSKSNNMLPCLIDVPLRKSRERERTNNNENTNERKHLQQQRSIDSDVNSYSKNLVNSRDIHTSCPTSPVGRRSEERQQRGQNKDWYKRMFNHLHKSIRSEEPNPYKPTYKFPTSKDDELYNCLDDDSIQGFNYNYIPRPSNYERELESVKNNKSTNQSYHNNIESKSLDNPFKLVDKQNYYNNDQSPSSSIYSKHRDIITQGSPRQTQNNKQQQQQQQQRDYTNFDQNNNNINSRTMSSSKLNDSSDMTSPNSIRRQQDMYKIVQQGGEIPLCGLQKYLADKSRESKWQKSQYENETFIAKPINNNNNNSISNTSYQQQQQQQPQTSLNNNRKTSNMNSNNNSPTLGDHLFENHRKSFRENDLDQQKDKVIYRDHSSNHRNVKSNNEMSRSSNMSNDGYICKAIAIHSFKPLNDRELAFKKGDIILVIKQVNDNWFMGEHHGFRGLFPGNYVYFLDSETDAKYDMHTLKTELLSLEGLAKVKYDFIPQARDELELHKGEMVSIIRRVDANWYEGYIGSQHGIFPVKYVETIKEPVETTTNRKSASPNSLNTHESDRSSGGNKYGGDSPSMSRSSNDCYYNSSSSIINQTTNNTYITKTYSNSSTQASINYPCLSDFVATMKPELFMALYTFNPNEDDEVELHKGDLILVYKKCDDGWYIGLSTRTGKFGSFPGNYVQPHNINTK